MYVGNEEMICVSWIVCVSNILKKINFNDKKLSMWVIFIYIYECGMFRYF